MNRLSNECCQAYSFHVFFTSRIVCSVRTAGSKIALRFQYVTTYVTMQLQYIAAFGGLQAELQQRKAVVCCLHGKKTWKAAVKILFSWRVATNWKRMTKVLSQHLGCLLQRSLL